MLWLAAMAVGAAALGCQQAPPEPDRSTSRGRVTTTSRALSWTIPPTWTVQRLAKRGEYRAKYEVPPQGNGKHPAELLVSHLGRGSNADVSKKLAELAAQFEGAVAKSPKREQLKVGNFTVEWLNIGGTYKFPMGPPMGRRKRHAAHVLKDNWRGLAAGVRTPKRGNWFFRMVGPEDTVQAARSAFRNMIENVK